MIPILWKEGEMIRSKSTGKPYSVIHIFKNVGTVIIDLQDTNAITFGLVLLERDYDQFALDMDMERLKTNGENHFKYNPIHL